MPLLNSASEYSSSNSNNGKKKGSMMNTFQNINLESMRSKETFQNISNNKNEDKVLKILEKMNVSENNESEGMTSYEPPSSKPKIEEFTALTKNQMVQSPPKLGITPMHKESGSSYSESYQPTPYYKGLKSDLRNNTSGANFTSNPQLMEKLNYMIHMLEEQQKEPTQNITEEFLLYGLMGVFIIYLVDSFTRAGKYIR